MRMVSKFDVRSEQVTKPSRRPSYTSIKYTTGPKAIFLIWFGSRWIINYINRGICNLGNFADSFFSKTSTRKSYPTNRYPKLLLSSGTILPTNLTETLENPNNTLSSPSATTQPTSIGVALGTINLTPLPSGNEPIQVYVIAHLEPGCGLPLTEKWHFKVAFWRVRLILMVERMKLRSWQARGRRFKCITTRLI